MIFVPEPSSFSIKSMKILVFVAFLNFHYSYQNCQDLVFSTRFDHHKIPIKTACISILVNKYQEQCAVYALLPIPTTMFKGVTID